MGAWQRVAEPGTLAPAGLRTPDRRQHVPVGVAEMGSRVAVGDVPEAVNAPETDAVDDRELVRQALARLPARQREVLLLRYYEDLSEAEIAKRLGCAPGTVKSSAARALQSPTGHAARVRRRSHASRRAGGVTAGETVGGDRRRGAGQPAGPVGRRS